MQTLNTNREIQFFCLMYTIRRFEETVLENFQKGVFFGTTHTYLGQEANAAGVLADLLPQDIVFSNHRCHGHFIAYGGEVRSLFAELMGKSTGVCGGRGGSQHLHWKNFYSNGVQGGIVPVATGMALAERAKHTQAVVIAFLGDGTLGEGVIYESFNMSSLWQAPILYVVENNQIAQTTPARSAVAGEIQARFSAFGISNMALDTSNVLEIAPTAAQLINQIRAGGGPHALVIKTCRFGPHSKGDDTRPAEEVAQLQHRRDPLKIIKEYLPPELIPSLEKEVDDFMLSEYRMALGDPLADPASLSGGLAGLL